MDRSASTGAYMRSSGCGSIPDDSESIVIPDTNTETQAPLGGGQTPLPKAQLAVLCLLRILDPLNFTQVFPYINELIWDLGVTRDPTLIGYYSGLVESVFAFAQLIAMYPWGFLSDTVGRRPVILAGTAGLALTSLIFGLSRDFNSILISRSLAGLFSGNVAVIPSVLCEITDRSNQAFAYSLFGIFWPIGTIIGPMIGGSLSNPTDKFPMLFNHSFFKKHPYFLPCCAITGFCALGFFSSCFFLKETLRKSRSGAGSGEELPATTRYGAINHQKAMVPGSISEERYNAKQLLGRPIIRAICTSACALSFVSTAFDVIFVLFCYSSVEHGGLGLSPQEIGFALAASGMAAALLSVVVMPKILARYNHARLYHFGMKLWTIPFLLLPVLNFVAKTGLEPGMAKPDKLTMIKLWIGVAALLAFVRVACMGFLINMLLVKAFVPSPSALDVTYGLVQFSICLSRSLSPVFASSLYVLSHQNAFLNGYSWVLVLVGFSWLGYLLSKRVVYYACTE